MDQNHKRILLTGSSSGIGYEAAVLLLKEGHKVTNPCRNKKTCNETLCKLTNDISPLSFGNDLCNTPICDLSDLNSVESLVQNLIALAEPIDTLILNAGLQYTGAKEPRWSFQGFELTFAVNHLSGFYLTRKLLPLLLKSKSPRIVITASEVHNPKSPGGRVGKPAGLGELLGLKQGRGFSIVDGITKFNADKAYKDSKLCNVLFGKELSLKLKSKGYNIPVIVWAPGLVIPRSKKGFFRYSRQYNETSQRIFAFLARDILRVTESPIKAGKILKDLSIEERYLSNHFEFYSNTLKSLGNLSFNKSTISEEASSSESSKLLWDYSSEVLGLNKDLD